MAKKTTLASIAAQIAKLDARTRESEGRFDKLESIIEKGFSAVADDIVDLKHELKGDIARVQTQVNSIEAELRLGRYETRLGNLEDKVFGAPRA